MGVVVEDSVSAGRNCQILVVRCGKPGHFKQTMSIEFISAGDCPIVYCDVVADYFFDDATGFGQYGINRHGGIFIDALIEYPIMDTGDGHRYWHNGCVRIHRRVSVPTQAD